jgi:hypothetical protein
MFTGMDSSAYSNMENIAWDMHVYPYAGASAQTMTSAVGAIVQSAQAVQGRDGPPPVFNFEYGPQYSPSNPIDAATIAAVQNNPAAGGSGSAAWAYDTSAQLNMVSGGGLTQWGQVVANYTAGSGAKGCNVSPDPALIPSSATIDPAGTATSGMLVPQNSLAGIQAPPGMN